MRTMKLQIALEYMIIFTFVLVVFLFLFALVASQRAQTSSSQVYSQEQLIAQSVATQIDTALRAGNGYTARVPVTGAIGTLAYQLLITKNGGVIVNATVGNQALQAFAFSTARNVVSSSSYLQANTFYYNLPIANGTLVIQNSFGTICVDYYSCPNSSTQATNVSLSSQVVHAAQFNGASSKVTMGALGTTNVISITAWVYFTSFPTAPVTAGIAGIGSSGATGDGFDLEICGAGYVNVHIQSQGSQCATAVPQISLNTWEFVAATETSGTVTVYVGTTSGVYATGVATSRTSQPLAIGYDPLCCANGYANARIANVQIYNSALSASQVQQLYQEGITGNPIAPANVVGWWLLNGNANDYSGQGNNGVINGPLLFPAVAELFAKVTNQVGYAISNALVGFTTTLGVLNGNAIPANQVYTNYTNANGIAVAFLNQQGNNGQALVKATAYNGNTALTANLVGWWPMNLGQGNTTFDLSGNGNAGSIEGGAGWSNPNYVAGFNGNTSYVRTNNALSTSTSTLTVGVWVYPTASGGNRGIVGQGDFGTDYWNLKTSGTKYDFVIYGIKDNTFGTLVLNKWSFLTATYNGAVVNLYVNGVQTASYSESATLVTSNSLYFGYTPGSDIPPLYFGGNMANVQVYNSVLSQQQISQLYQEGISGPPVGNMALDGWWPLNGNANDYSGNGFNGTIYGNLRFSSSPTATDGGNNATGVIAASFNGVADISVPAATSLNASSIAVSAWVNPYASGDQAIISKSNTCGGGIDNGWVLELINNYPSVWIYGVTSGWVSSSTLAVATNALSDVGFTYASGRLTFYVNGQNSTVTTTTSNDLPLNDVNLLIGNQGACNLFHGNISNVQMYNTALTSRQMQQVYGMGQAGLPLANSSLVAWWPLNGNSNDYSGKGNNGTAYNVIYSAQQATLPNAPVVLSGSGIGLNGENGYMNVPASGSIDSWSTFTIGAWVYFRSQGFEHIVAERPVSGPYNFDLWMGATGYKLRLGIYAGGGQIYMTDAQPGTTMQPGTWYYVVGEYDGTDLYTYLNGALDYTLGASGATNQGSEALTVGSAAYDGGHYCNCAISNVQLYNSALSSNQIEQLYLSQTPPSASAVIPLSWFP